jgi:hypothetical protein
LHIVARPFFWGFVAMFGVISAISHGFCRCIRPQRQDQLIWDGFMRGR